MRVIVRAPSEGVAAVAGASPDDACVVVLDSLAGFGGAAMVTNVGSSYRGLSRVTSKDLTSRQSFAIFSR